MKKTLLTSLIVTSLFSTPLFAQVDEYTGVIGKSPIHLILDTNEYDHTAIYSYDKYDTPIFLNGENKNGDLVFTEQDDSFKPVATITIDDFFKGDNSYLITQTGTWKSLVNGKSYPLSLKHSFDFNNTNYDARPMMIYDSNKQHYFKRMLANDGDGIEAKGLRIYEKGTENLIQEFPEFWAVNLSDFFYTINTDDYNFDGYEDFSVVVETYAGSNTLSDYYLWNPKTKQYYLSSISGISLEFDHNKKRIYDVNRSGAGRYQNITSYKLDKNDTMIELGTKCYELEFRKEGNEYVEIKCD